VRFVSMFSGIEAASVAWTPLGWAPLAVSEVEAFPRAVLEHRVLSKHPDCVLHGDMLAVDWGQYRGRADVVVGGPPCQAFSVAGLRKSLDDDRGNLSLAYVRAIHAIEPRWAVTENVPGWLSTNDNAFGCFLGGLVGADAPLVSPLERGRWTGAGVVSGPLRTAAWRVIDAQFHGVAQRRRRVFVLSVRGAGNWACAEALFPQCDGVPRYSPPSREAGEGAAPTLAARTRGGGGLGTDFDCDGGLIPDVAFTVTAREGKGPNSDCDSGNLIAHTLRADGFDASEDGTGRGTPLVPIAFGGQMSTPQVDVELSQTLQAKNPQAIALTCKDSGGDAGDLSPTLRAMGHDGSHANAGGQVAVAVDVYNGAVTGDVSATLTQASGDSNKSGPSIMHPMAVRRITPREAERLQGFEDDHTLIPWRGKPANQCPDGPRYKALGNSMAVPCMAWLGSRIAAVEALTTDLEAAA
jgi:DNA (cytosine-5)-methyltransferase 1